MLRCDERRRATEIVGGTVVHWGESPAIFGAQVDHACAASVAPLEVREFAHEGRRDLGVDLAVEEERPVRLPQLRCNLVQVLKRADGRGLEAKPFGDGGEVNIREYGLGHRLLPEPQKVELRAV